VKKFECQDKVWITIKTCEARYQSPPEMFSIQGIRAAEIYCGCIIEGSEWVLTENLVASQGNVEPFAGASGFAENLVEIRGDVEHFLILFTFCDIDS